MNMQNISSVQGLKISNLTASYRKIQILSDISISELKPGTINVLVGPNGAGKSTLLKAIAGFLPTTGNMTLGGKDLSTQKIDQRARHISYLPQTPLGELELSLLESMVDAANIKGKSTKAPICLQDAQLEERALSLLAELELEKFALTPLSRLSGGQRQMASFAQTALAAETCNLSGHLFMLDEPTSALDLRRQEQIMRHIGKLSDNGCIILMVMHDLSLAARWAERIIVLNNGMVEADDSPQNALTPDLLGKLYGVKANISSHETGGLQIQIEGLS